MDSMNNSIDAAEQQRRQDLPITAFATDLNSFLKNPPADRMNQWLTNTPDARSFEDLLAVSFKNETEFGCQFPKETKEMMLAYERQQARAAGIWPTGMYMIMGFAALVAIME